MGIEDRDWYREKQIDWERGGLRNRQGRNRKRRSLSIWWILAAIALFIAIGLIKGF